ncbi:hypothetical protein CRYUN_Cryun41cG0072200 [Craigia yunnanensis]
MADAPEVVAKAFQEQYYHFLVEIPEFVNRFYKDSSSVRWEGQDGVMRHTTMKDIFDYFLSFSDVKKFDILSSDTQDSDRGLIVLVIGCMTFKNDKTRKLSQTFFLVPQENGGYFVLNDLFRFLDDEEANTSNLLQSTNHEPTLIASPQVVASAFVDKYYHHLREGPEFVHEFYKDSSRVVWKKQDGVMSNVTTLKGISDHFLPFSNAKKYDILSYEAQNSFDNGLLIVVIGCVTLKNDKPKKFSQTFFLAPQENGGHFVLNDVFSFLDDEKALKIHAGETSDALPSICHESAVDQEITTVCSSDSKKEANSNNPTIPVTETSCSAVQKNSKPLSIPAAENSDTSASQDSNLNTVKALEGTTIFVGNLIRETEVELIEAFKRFGPIKPNGVRIRSTREKKRRYGFIEFESSTSAQTAVQASSIRIGKRNINIEAKKLNN